MKKITIFMLLILGVSYNYAQSLNRSWALKYEIQDKLVPIIGDSSMVMEVVEMDSAKVDEYTKDDFADPYGTLSDCTIFSVGPKAAPNAISNFEPGTYWFGVYKNGEVIWLSDSSYSENPLGSSFISTLDINKDGKVDIINQLTEVDINGYLEGFLYIISWDGHNGMFLNDGGKHSKISNYKGFFQPIDLNNDGIYEFESDTWQYNETTDEWDSSKVVCCWNGEKYGIFSDCPQYPTPATYPSWPYTKANDFETKLNTEVKRNGKMYEYKIKIKNLLTSKQKISRFYFNYNFDSIYYIKPIEKGHFITRLSNHPVFGFTINSDSLLVSPGDSIEYVYKNDNLPKITQGYLLAPNFMLANYLDQFGIYSDNNILNNSVKKKSLAPAKLPDPFIPNEFLDTLTSYTDSSYSLGWIKDEQTRDKYDNYFSAAKTYVEQGDSSMARAELQKVLTDCNTDSSSVLTSEAYALLYFNTEYLVNKLPEAPAVEGLPVKLEDSQGSLLQGGSLQYYDSGWKDAIDNGDGTFTVQTERKTVSLKMVYASGSQQVDNVTVGNTPYIFQTVNTTVKLLNSQGAPIDEGQVKYYASGWKDFGTTQNGVTTKELLPVKYTFKMSYEGGSINKDQGIDTNTTVIFQTVNTEVQLKDSQGNLLDGGNVKYYASGWKDFGQAANGTAAKELLPKQYTFQMEYGGASINKDQDVSQNPVIVFQTVKAEVQLKDSQGNLLDGGNVKYYASGWKNFGQAANGTVAKELLPKKYTFQMQYGGASINKDQDVSQDPVVVFRTVKAEVQLKDSQGNLLDGGNVKYYASGWKDFGQAINGSVTKELLSKQYTFQMQYGGASINKDQDVSQNTVVVFQTVKVEVQLKDSQGNLLDGGFAKYYASGWKDFGQATNGTVTKELLPKQYTFQMEYEGISNNKDQDISTNPTVIFNTVLTTVQVKDAQNQQINGAEVSYYGSGWKVIGNTVNGEVTKELLPRQITFKAKYNSKQAQKDQDISTNNIVQLTIE